MSFGGKYRCPLDGPPPVRRQAGGSSSGWVRAAARLRTDKIEQSRQACVEARRRSRSPRRHPGYSVALSIGPSARLVTQRIGASSSRVRSSDAQNSRRALKAFRPMRKLSAFRYPLRIASNRGSNAPLDEAERSAAMAEVTQDV